MQESIHFLEDDFIIYNYEFGVRDFVNIGEIDFINNTAYLVDPYEMVGPFCLNELCSFGIINFEACVVMSKEYWRNNRILIQEESLHRQKKLQEDLYKHIDQKNKRKRYNKRNMEKEYRRLLCLPKEGLLDVFQIKVAYKKIVKKVHPELGGSHEEFIQLTNAKDSLLELVA